MAAERGRTRPARRGELGGKDHHQNTTGKDGEWKKKNTRGTRSLQKQAERIERGQKRRLENPHREREEPPAPEAPAAPPEEESSEESLDTEAPPLVLQEAPVPQKPADEESEESSSDSSSSSSSEQEPEPLPAHPAVSQQAERIRAVRLESSESEGKPSGPLFTSKGPSPATAEQSGAGGTAKEGGET